MIYLRQILPLFVLPLGITLIVLLFGLWSRRRWMMWVGITILWVSSTPWVGGFAVRVAEGWAERSAPGDAPTADVIVVLSTGRVVAPGHAAISEWTDADRFFAGVELFQAGKAPLVVFTGGWVPWLPDDPLEGDVLAEYAKAAGIPPDHIITTGRVTNTADEARAVATLMRARQTAVPRVLLVTSAFHMARAEQLFERAGLTVAPFPVDFRHSGRGGMGLLDFLPNAGALAQTQMALREMYGRLFYRV